MRAAVCNEFGRPLVIEELDLKAPGAGEVALRVAACGVCHSDVSFIDGAWGGYLPAVFGHEVAGVVTAVGPGVETVREGDHALVTLVRTCGRCFFCLRGEPTQCEGRFAIDEPGPLRRGDLMVKQGLHVAGFAEQVTVDASQVVKVPDGMPLDVVCLVSCAVATGYGAVRNTARVPEGASVAVIGVGGVGLNVVQAAALTRADPVVAIDLSDARLEAAKRFGASHTVNGRQADTVQEVHRLTAGRGADFVFVAAGAAAAAAQGLALVRRAGTVVLVGIPATGATAPFDPGEIADAGLHVLGCKLGSIRPHVDLPMILDHYRDGELRLDELVTGRFSLDQVNEAIDMTRRGEGLRSVIVP
jgi:S-(hydroxymethyl)glutathione dehydrogenase/alcohol dehydrogenase